MYGLDFENDSYSDSDESSYNIVSVWAGEVGDEQLHSHSSYDDDSEPEEGSYSEKPIADEQCLQEYNQKKKGRESRSCTGNFKSTRWSRSSWHMVNIYGTSCSSFCMLHFVLSLLELL